MEKEKFELYQRIVTLELGMDRQAAEIRQLQEKPKWLPSLGTKKQGENASTETDKPFFADKVVVKSPEATSAAKVVAYDQSEQFDKTCKKSAMSSPTMSDNDSGCSNEGLIMGAVSDFLDERRVISSKPIYSRTTVPLPGEETEYKKGAVLEAVDEFLDTLEECRDD